jgi:hypothetical protein
MPPDPLPSTFASIAGATLRIASLTGKSGTQWHKHTLKLADLLRQGRVSGSAVVGGAQLPHVHQAAHDLEHLLLRGHRFGLIHGGFRDALQLAEATAHAGEAGGGHAIAGRALVRLLGKTTPQLVQMLGTYHKSTVALGS